MKVKNTSSRMHHVGGVSIAPGQEADIPAGWEDAINKDELTEVKAEKPAKVKAETEVKAEK